MSPADARFLAAFEAGALAPSEFRHADHLRAAFLLLEGADFADALARMKAGLKRIAAAHGAPGRYHETLTVAFVALVNERRYAMPGADWAAFARANPDLFNARALEAHYPPGVLATPLARAVFVLPPGHG